MSFNFKASFESPQDMLMKMSEVTDATDTVDKSCFTEGARKLGWEDGCEDVLYHSLDDEDCSPSLGFPRRCDANHRFPSHDAATRANVENARLQATTLTKHANKILIRL